MITTFVCVEHEGLRSAGELALGPECFDQLSRGHASARANVEAGVAAELFVDRLDQAFSAVLLARSYHHFEDFVAVDLNVFYVHNKSKCLGTEFLFDSSKSDAGAVAD